LQSVVAVVVDITQLAQVEVEQVVILLAGLIFQIQ
jgi:hypothetical protein